MKDIIDSLMEMFKSGQILVTVRGPEECREFMRQPEQSDPGSGVEGSDEMPTEPTDLNDYVLVKAVSVNPITLEQKDSEEAAVDADKPVSETYFPTHERKKRR